MNLCLFIGISIKKNQNNINATPYNHRHVGNPQQENTSVES